MYLTFRNSFVLLCRLLQKTSWVLVNCCGYVIAYGENTVEQM